MKVLPIFITYFLYVVGSNQLQRVELWKYKKQLDEAFKYLNYQARRT